MNKQYRFILLFKPFYPLSSITLEEETMPAKRYKVTMSDEERSGLQRLVSLGKAFVLEGMESALRRKKQERPSNLKFDGQKEAQLVALRCSSPPQGRERWTLKLLADKLIELEVFESISPKSVGERLKKMNLNLG
jgi:hypothetical protein